VRKVIQHCILTHLGSELIANAKCTHGYHVRRSLFDKTGLFDEDLFSHEDTSMRIKMATVGCLVPGEMDEPVAMRRLHHTNLSFETQEGGSDPIIEKNNEILCQWGRERVCRKGK